MDFEDETGRHIFYQIPGCLAETNIENKTHLVTSYVHHPMIETSISPPTSSVAIHNHDSFIVPEVPNSTKIGRYKTDHHLKLILLTCFRIEKIVDVSRQDITRFKTEDLNGVVYINIPKVALEEKPKLDVHTFRQKLLQKAAQPHASTEH